MNGVRTGCARILAAAAVALSAAACDLPGVSPPGASAGSAGQGASPGRRQAAGQGIASQPPDVILAAARQALRGAQSVHVRGSLTDPGRGRIAVNLRIGRNAAYGKIKAPVRGTPVLVSLIKARGKVYLRGRQLWQKVGGAAAAGRFGNRWVVVDRRSAPGVANFTKLTTLSGLSDALQPGGGVTKNGERSIGGLPAIALKDRAGDLLYVKTTGKPYPLLLANAQSGKGALNLYEYNDPVRVSAPRGAVAINR
jgi:hypothetical protein